MIVSVLNIFVNFLVMYLLVVCIFEYVLKVIGFIFIVNRLFFVLFFVNCVVVIFDCIIILKVFVFILFMWYIVLFLYLNCSDIVFGVDGVVFIFISSSTKSFRAFVVVVVVLLCVFLCVWCDVWMIVMMVDVDVFVMFVVLICVVIVFLSVMLLLFLLLMVKLIKLLCGDVVMCFFVCDVLFVVVCFLLCGVMFGCCVDEGGLMFMFVMCMCVGFGFFVWGMVWVCLRYYYDYYSTRYSIDDVGYCYWWCWLLMRDKYGLMMLCVLYVLGFDEWVIRRRVSRTRVGFVFDVFFERRMFFEVF